MSCEGSQSIERRLQFRELHCEAKESSVHRKERDLGSILVCGYVHGHVHFRKRSWYLNRSAKTLERINLYQNQETRTKIITEQTQKRTAEGWETGDLTNGEA